jgi:hypothetical protein
MPPKIDLQYSGAIMLVTLSEARFSARIRQLENIPQSTSDEEINHRLDRHATTLFQHLSNYGFVGFDRVAVNGTLGTFRATLAPCHDDESRNTRIQGLAMLDPVSVSLESQDLPAFFRGMLLTMMEDNFANYSREFQRLTVRELDSKLVDTATKVFAAPMPTPFIPETEEDHAAIQEIRDEEFNLWCIRSGVKNPGAERRAREAAEAAEIQSRKAAQDKALMEQWGR